MREESARCDLEVAEVAFRQHGVIASVQLSAAGLSTSAISRRVDAGRLHRVHRGVYAVGHAGISSRGKWMAAVLACGKANVAEAALPVLLRWGAALSYRSAACLWGLLAEGNAPVDVSVPGAGGKRRRVGIRLHRSETLSSAQVTLCDGIPVTTVARTIADMRRVSQGGAPLISSREFRRAVRQANILGLPIGDGPGLDRTRSDLERDFLALCRRHHLPAPNVNVRLGPHLVDFVWRNRMLVVETDGYRYHRGRTAFGDDRARDLDLRARGFEVIRLAEKQVNEESALVAEVVGAALRVGADAARVR